MSREQTVFVVDDDVAVARAVSRFLKAHGYPIKVFNSAQEFMDFYKPELGGCLVLDLSMPRINGLELQSWMVSKGHLLPILFLTGSDDIPENKRAMMLAGAVDILKKPVEGSALIKAVEEALARDRKR